MSIEEAVTKVQTMYVAYYGRPGDPAGVDYWALELNANGGNLNAIIDAFGNSPEFVDNYAELGSEALVTTLFQQILGREADPAGLQFYVDLLDSASKSLASIALDVANGVQGSDIDTLAHRLEVAQVYSAAIAATGIAYGEAELDAAKALLAAVDSTQASVDGAAVDVADSVAQAAGVDVAGDASTDIALRLSYPVHNSLETVGDIDVFSVQLEAGLEYHFELAGLSSGDGSLLDPWLGLFSDSDDYLALNDDGGKGLNSHVVFTAEASGTYFLAAQAAGDDLAGSYSLSMDWVGNDSIADDAGTRQSLRVGETLHSHIDAAADKDWFAIELTEGIDYRLKLAGSSLPDPALALYDEFGQLLREDDDGGAGLESIILYTPTASGRYYLEAAGSANDMAMGNYSVTVREPFNRTPLTIAFDDPGGELDAFRNVIEENLQAAWDNWDLYIDGAYGAQLDIVVSPFYEEGEAVTLAAAGPEFYAGLGGQEGIIQGAPAQELSTGADTNGDEADGFIQINTFTLAEDGFFDFSPNGFTPAVKTSFEEVLTHELGHIIGFIGGLFVASATPFENLSNAISAEFTGARAVAENGGPIALDADSLVHLDQAIFQGSMMTPVASYGGLDEITELEIAMLADIGLPIHDQYLFS